MKLQTRIVLQVAVAMWVPEGETARMVPREEVPFL